jgi:hypothetical protein
MYRGEVVGHIREFLDRMLEVILKARRPEKYRENVALELSSSLGGPLRGRTARGPSRPNDREREPA